MYKNSKNPINIAKAKNKNYPGLLPKWRVSLRTYDTSAELKLQRC